MIIFPAIDLKDGSCVRLTQGDFDKSTVYETDPVLQAKKFADAGAEWLHMVDLDGAKDSEMRQFNVIAAVAAGTPLRLQVGGGIRSEKTIDRLLKAGVERVVIGSLAVKNRSLVKEWLKTFGPQHLVVAFDIRFKDNEPEILTHGWQSGSEQLLWDTLESYDGSGLQNVLCTDVSRDGMLTGTNMGLYEDMQARWPKLQVLASGGVSGMDDVVRLKSLGVAGVIIGKALYEHKIDLAEACAHAR